LVIKACPERMAIKREDSDDRYVLSEGAGAKLGQQAIGLKGSEFLCCPILRARPKGEPSIEVALPIQKSELLEHLRDRIETKSVLFYDPVKKKVLAHRERRWSNLVLEVLPSAEVSTREKQACFWKMVKDLPSLAELPLSDSATAWLNRYHLLHGECPELPSLDESELMANLEHWLAPYMAGIHTWSAFEKCDWISAIEGLTEPAVLTQLNQCYPSHITLTNGMKKALDYHGSAGPILALRIQELFGCSSVPKVGPRQLPLTLHLLSPARRPVQITADLESFWKTGYFEARKELKRRYPKHLWPDDPAHAELADRYRRN
jgi:ATP-dependent helicase HrpB